MSVSAASQPSSYASSLQPSSNCHPHTAPEHLAVLAWLFGLEPPSVGTARVLELGCGSGANLLPFATRNRRAKVLGIDRSDDAVESGLQAVRQLGLNNVRLHAADLGEITGELGQFDYIICHDHYSHLSSQDRRAVARICKENLAANGIAYVNFNTYPGWKSREMVRDAMLLRLSGRVPGVQELAEAQGMFDFLKRWAHLGGSALKGAVEECESLRGDPARLSTFLEPSNTPFYLTDFVQRFEQHGLAYLADTRAAGMFINHFPEGVQQALLSECGNSQVALEQYFDILTNRSSRQTLLVHAEQADAIRYRLAPERLAKLHVTARFECEGAVQLDDSEQSFRVADGRRVGLRGAAMKVAAYRLNELWPRTQNLPALLAYVEQQLGSLPPNADAQLLDLFEHIVVSDFGRFRLSAVVGGPGAAGMPRVDPEVIAYAQLSGCIEGSVTFNPWHESVTLDAFSALLLPLLDGCHTQDELLDVIADAVAEGRLGFLRDDRPITDRAELGRVGVLHLHRVLESLLA
ncbi:methyltransferase regulatory domain-containing protein [Pseudomonas sp. PDM19]|uniref:methyltransferase regulatory domain-containing protein n=1 Tax=Pseudomonas sp. PDM19 TaxID=2769272 RepID=UPI0017877361|nr:class I SAM-dependent methyltransferase [Pseudomonas sp. PDM19]MBD9629267.1 class I SAM-dependent methyltransferase [Pseudomonas sp. PDM19]